MKFSLKDIPKFVRLAAARKAERMSEDWDTGRKKLTRPEFCTVFVTPDGLAVATNGHRLHVAPCKNASETAILLPTDPCAKKSKASDFPAWRTVPEGCAAAPTIHSVRVMAGAIRGVTVPSRSVALYFAGDNVRAERGGFKDRLGSAVINPRPGEFGFLFDGRYILDALAYLDRVAQVTVDAWGYLDPIRITRPGGQVAYVMPMRT